MLGRWYGMIKSDTRDTVDMIRKDIREMEFSGLGGGRVWLRCMLGESMMWNGMMWLWQKLQEIVGNV